MAISRRALLQATVAISLLHVLPRVGSISNRLSFVRDATAGWLAAAQVALTAVALFVRSDGGMSAMLANIKELQKETIRLSQSILAGIGDLQSTLATMPNIIREQLSSHQEYRVVEETESIRLKLEYCEKEQKRGKRQSAVLREIVSRAMDLARYRSVPYGIAGRAAMCAPLVVSIDARARQLLGNTAEIPSAVHAAYLPWIRSIQSREADGSLAKSLHAAGEIHAIEIARIGDVMPPLVKAYLGADFISNALKLDPGATAMISEVACGQYERITGYQRGKCLRETWCDPNDGPTCGAKRPCYFFTPESLEEQGLALKTPTQPMKNDSISRICRSECLEYENKAITQPESHILSAIRAENLMLSPTSLENMAGPMFTLTAQWKGGTGAPPNCTRYLVGTNQGEQQFVDLKSSDRAKEWENQFTQFVQGPLAKINDYRQSIYAMYQLLSSVKEAERLLVKVYA